MPSLPRSLRTARRERGISLVEILVGVIVGLIGVVIIFQVLAIAEARKRNSTSASDAQVSGALALYSLDRDARLAGYGFGTAAENQMGCMVQASDNRSTTGGTTFQFRLGPVVIDQGTGANGSDRISVLYGSSSLFVATRGFGTSTATTKVMESGGRAGFLRGDVVIAAPVNAGAACGLVEITDNTAADTVTLTHAQGTYVSDYGPVNTTATARYNSTTATVTGPGFAYNLGPNPHLDVWEIIDNKLQSHDALHSEVPMVQVADNIVNMQAEYGIDGNGDNLIGNGEWTTATPTTNADWRNVRAIRVALLARSAQWDPTHCSATPEWTSGAGGQLALTPFVMRDVNGDVGNNPPPCNPGDDLTNAARNPNNWWNYRYRVYETVIPLRNMIWGTAP